MLAPEPNCLANLPKQAHTLRTPAAVAAAGAASTMDAAEHM